MTEIQVYIENLNKYVEGESKGAWFTLPVTFEAIAEKIGINSHDEYAIYEFEAPFHIDEHEDLAYLNRVAKLYEEYSDRRVTRYLGELVSDGGYFSKIDEAFDNIDGLHFYVEKDDLINRHLELEGVPSKLWFYIDKEIYFRDLSITNPNLFITSDGAVIDVSV